MSLSVPSAWSGAGTQAQPLELHFYLLYNVGYYYLRFGVLLSTTSIDMSEVVGDRFVETNDLENIGLMFIASFLSAVEREL